MTRILTPNNDLSNPEKYKSLSSNQNHSGKKVRVYGCRGKEWFVIGEGLHNGNKVLFLDDLKGWKTIVNFNAKTYWKSSDYELIG